jgi:hypothetical protein
MVNVYINSVRHMLHVLLETQFQTGIVKGQLLLDFKYVLTSVVGHAP